MFPLGRTEEVFPFWRREEKYEATLCLGWLGRCWVGKYLSVLTDCQCLPLVPRPHSLLLNMAGCGTLSHCWLHGPTPRLEVLSAPKVDSRHFFFFFHFFIHWYVYSVFNTTMAIIPSVFDVYTWWRGHISFRTHWVTQVSMLHWSGLRISSQVAHHLGHSHW